MASRYERRNDTTIRKAFRRLQVNKDSVIEDGMRRLLKDATEYAVSVHDHEHFGHRITGNSYGWALVHDGAVKHIQVNSGKHGQGDAEDQLRSVAGRINREGWVGIILASMYMEFGRRKPIYFEVDYEIGVLDFTQDEIADHFAEYFRPIQ